MTKLNDLDKNDINKDGVVDEQDLKSLITERDKFPINSDTWNRLDQEVSRFKKRYNILDDDLTALQAKRKLIKEKYPKP